MKWIKWIGFIGLGLWMTIGADAFAFRCNGRLVNLGDYQYEVLDKCGPPSTTHTWEEDRYAYFSKYYDHEEHRYRAPRAERGPLTMERWSYILGAQRFTRHLLFENGVLIRIELGAKQGN